MSIHLLFSIAYKIDNYCYRNSWKSNNYTESNIEKKPRLNFKNQYIKWRKEVKSVNFCYCKFGGAITKWGATNSMDPHSELIILSISPTISINIVFLFGLSSVIIYYFWNTYDLAKLCSYNFFTILQYFFASFLYFPFFSYCSQRR